MKTSNYTNYLLTLIAISLLVIVVRPYLALPAAQAQSTQPYPFYIEPGYTTLRAPDGSRQVLGKVVVDLRNGKIWGFPTFATQTYPVNATSSAPATSHPFLLGRFALEDMEKAGN